MISFTDNDFYGRDARGGLSIEATLADLPVGQSLLAESRFGLLLGGVDADGVLQDEPGNGEPTLTLRLDVDNSLEPNWRVVTATDPEGRWIGARDRAALGVALIGTTPERQFSWSRGSALARERGDDVADILLEAHRVARDAAAEVSLAGLDQTLVAARDAGARLGTSDFYVRLNNSTSLLNTADALEYAGSRGGRVS